MEYRWLQNRKALQTSTCFEISVIFFILYLDKTQECTKNFAKQNPIEKGNRKATNSNIQSEIKYFLFLGVLSI